MASGATPRDAARRTVAVGLLLHTGTTHRPAGSNEKEDNGALSQESLTFAADLTLFVHAAFVVFVVAGQALVMAGWMLGWTWPRNLPFRLVHAGAIALVVLESWFGVVCPLTWLEFRLRAAAGSPGVADSFVGYWLQRLIFYDAPPWAFTLVYTLFAALVALSLLCYPPRRRSVRRGTA